MPDYNREKIKPAWQLPFEGAWPMAVALCGSHRRVAAGNQDGQLLVWDLPDAPVPAKVKDENGKEIDGVAAPPPVLSLVGHTNGITHLAASADGKTLISTSLDRSVRIWDLSAAPQGEVEVVLDLPRREREAKRVEEKKREAILKAPGVKTGKLTPLAVLEGHKDWVCALGLSADGHRAISGCDSGLAIVWDLAARKPVSQWQCPGVAWIVAAALSADGQTALVSQYRKKGGDYNNYPAGLRLYNVADGSVKLDILTALFPKEKNPKYQYQYEYSKLVGMGLVAVAISPDGKTLAAGQGGEESEGQVHFFEAATGKVIRSATGHKYGVTAVRFSADGKHLFTAGRDTMYRIFTVADGKEVAAIGKSRGGQFFDWLSAISLSPDEKWLAASDIGGQIQLWQLT